MEGHLEESRPSKREREREKTEKEKGKQRKRNRKTDMNDLERG